MSSTRRDDGTAAGVGGPTGPDAPGRSGEASADGAGNGSGGSGDGSGGNGGSTRRYGTFEGVFTPTLLTILGVIMYLRHGWVVGNAGLIGAWGIVLLAFAITGATGLSLSSIATNTRIGAGGAFSVIAKSLGLEVGGAIGVPLYVAQALVVALYVFGFRTGWLYLFPTHDALLVDLVVFAVLFGIALVGPNLAFRLQYLILALVVASLVTVAVTGFFEPVSTPITWLGDYPGAPETGFAGTTFWGVFAVFFPASTGILAGANLSGELKDPGRSIPLGTMGAIGVAVVVYMLLAWWLAVAAPPGELVADYTVLISRALNGPVVLAGLLAATFSSAMASLVGAPRILQAIAEHRVVPGSETLARITRGEPRNAVLLTGVIVLAALLLRELNVVAPLITMFFLVTYTTINGVALIEQGLGLTSFRPLLRVPVAVPAAGALGCLFAMFVVNPVFGLLAVASVVAFYAALVRRRLRGPFDDVRSGLFRAVAEWAARRVSVLTDEPAGERRTWKPNLLLPAARAEEVRGVMDLLEALTSPRGSVQVLALPDGDAAAREGLQGELPELAGHLRAVGVYAAWTIVDDEPVVRAASISVKALQGSLFAPNTVLLRLPAAALPPEGAAGGGANAVGADAVGDGADAAGDGRVDERRGPASHTVLSDAGLHAVLREAERSSLGALLLADHPQAGLGRRRVLNLWIEDQAPDWPLDLDLGNLDLPVLVGYTLARNWDARLHLLMAVDDPGDVDDARAYLARLVEAARLPEDTDTHVLVGAPDAVLRQAPNADLSLFTLEERPDLDALRGLVEAAGTTCLFVRDSGHESALA